MLGTDPRVPCIEGKCSTTESQPHCLSWQPSDLELLHTCHPAFSGRISRFLIYKPKLKYRPPPYTALQRSPLPSPLGRALLFNSDCFLKGRDPVRSPRALLETMTHGLICPSQHGVLRADTHGKDTLVSGTLEGSCREASSNNTPCPDTGQTRTHRLGTKSVSC